MIHSMHIIGSRQMGGAEHFFIRFVRALERRGIRILAVTRPGCPLSAALTETVPQQSIPMRNGLDFWSVLKIRGLIRRTRPLIVQTYMGRASRLTRLPRDSAAVHVARLGGYYKVKGYYRQAHAWVANTRGLCDYLVREGLDADRIYQIGNFVELPPPPDKTAMLVLRQSLRLPADALVVFALGRFIQKKGFGDLLAAFAQVPREIHGRPVVLVIAGDGPFQEPLHRLARQLALSPRLRWVGWLDEPGPYYDLADVFVCPSRLEPLGNVILEAWAHRLPVISTRTAGALELVAPDQNGLLVEIRDPDALAAGMTALIEAGPAAWRDLAESGLRSLKQNHTEEAVMESYLALYAQLQPGRAARN